MRYLSSGWGLLMSLRTCYIQSFKKTSWDLVFFRSQPAGWWSIAILMWILFKMILSRLMIQWFYWWLVCPDMCGTYRVHKIYASVLLSGQVRFPGRKMGWGGFWFFLEVSSEPSPLVHPSNIPSLVSQTCTVSVLDLDFFRRFTASLSTNVWKKLHTARDPSASFASAWFLHFWGCCF